jgi:flagellar basal body rod protein FlgG
VLQQKRNPIRIKKTFKTITRGEKTEQEAFMNKKQASLMIFNILCLKIEKEWKLKKCCKEIMKRREK